MSLLAKLCEIGVDYSQFVRDVTIKQEFSQDNYTKFIKQKQGLDEFNMEFIVWKKSKETKEDLDAKLKKKRRMLGVKWEERDLVNKVS
jgi:hypothetical protein